MDMTDTKYDAFISYSHADQEFVWRLARHLTTSGLQIFFDQAELAVGDTLVSRLTEAVRSARFLLVVMSPDYFSSRWAASELQLALTDEWANGTVKVIPLLRRDCEIPPLLAGKVWADFRIEEKFKDSLARLLSTLQAGRKGQLPVTPSSKGGASVGQVEAPLDDKVAEAFQKGVNEAVQRLLAKPLTRSGLRLNGARVDPKKCGSPDIFVEGDLAGAPHGAEM